MLRIEQAMGEARWNVSPGFIERQIELHCDLEQMRREHLRNDLMDLLRPLTTAKQRAILNMWLYEIGLIVHRRRGYGGRYA